MLSLVAARHDELLSFTIRCSGLLRQSVRLRLSLRLSLRLRLRLSLRLRLHGKNAVDLRVL